MHWRDNTFAVAFAYKNLSLRPIYMKNDNYKDNDKDKDILLKIVLTIKA